MKTKTLLVVDADAEAGELISLAVVKTGHRVMHAHSSREALSIIRRGSETFDLIVIDVGTGIHGLGALEAIEISPMTPPVIVLTAPNEPYLNGLAAARSAAASLARPFTAEKLAATIEEVTNPASRSARCTSDAFGPPHQCKNEKFPCPGCRRQQMPKLTPEEYANL